MVDGLFGFYSEGITSCRKGLATKTLRQYTPLSLISQGKTIDVCF